MADPLISTEGPARQVRTIDVSALPAGATFLRILGVNYINLKTSDDGDLYLTQYGFPFRQHLDPANWYEQEWFKAKRERLEGTSTVYRVPTRPVQGHPCRSLDLVVKWSRVGQDVPLDTFTLNKTINAEFNSPFEEFSLVEELRRGSYGPRDLRILMQKPLAIYAPPERMQLWQSGRSREKVLSRVARHPAIEIDILKSYILLYAWIKGFNAVDMFASLPWDREKQLHEQLALVQAVNRDLEKKGFIVADNKPTHMIMRPHKGNVRRRKSGRMLYAMVDYELLLRTSEHEEHVKQSGRSRYLQLQEQRFAPKESPQWPPDLAPMNVLGVDYVYGTAQSTRGALWVVGKHPELFAYFLPERWRFKRINLSPRRQTYYVCSKDRIHLVWEVSRLGELANGQVNDPAQEDEVTRYGYNSPFEEFAYALQLQARGVKTTYPRAVYQTGQEVQMPSCILDESRFARLGHIKTPQGQPILRLDRDHVLIWGYWRGLEDDERLADGKFWTPIDVEQAVAKGLIPAGQGEELVQEHRRQLLAAGFEDLTLRGSHILMSYIPEGPFKTRADGMMELRQCNFETVRPIARL